MEIKLQKATPAQLPQIWAILQQAIAQRKADGSLQWQNGYPNEEVVAADITAGNGYAFLHNNQVIAYIAILFGVEIPYTSIEGRWLTEGAYATLHRLAVADAVKGKGLAGQLLTLAEDYCARRKVPSIRLDTSTDNQQMLRTAARLGYTYCGIVYQGGAPRNAYEKVLRSR